jgi:pilus assembly protein Flp/PilA
MIRRIAAAVRRFLAEEDGPAAIEYAVLLMLALLMLITAIQAIGRALSSNLQESSDELNKALKG